MSYTFYKIAHIAILLIFVSSLTASYCLDAKKPRILGMIASFLLLVAGFGLMARLGMMGLESWPLWLKLKLGIWLIISIGAPIAQRKLTKNKPQALMFWIGLFIIAVILGISKPV